MYIAEILLASFFATAFMSSYMYLISWFSGKEYRVPVLLGSMLGVRSESRQLLDYSGKAKRKGLFVHYISGAVFAFGFYIAWVMEWLPVSMPAALIFGSAIGVVGIVVWNIFLRSNPFPVKFNRVKFFFHLFIAHLIFSLTLLFFFEWIVKAGRQLEILG